MSLERTERREPSIATPSATGHTPSPGRPHLTPAIQWDPPRAVQRHREVDKTIVDVVIVLVIAWKNHGLRRASRFELVELVELVWSSRVASPRELNGSRELPRAEAAANGRPGKVALLAAKKVFTVSAGCSPAPITMALVTSGAPQWAMRMNLESRGKPITP
ncbi:hypothetical protein M430DRAFT_20524 [Amorphotheca resinae ATCC 22711]|uniref:Uncharacterized protein n=1 Tax=Amorphotheca resinae ATCC 22711 TaxID=857342 RepID=A0A2T3AYU9_AMORE|nr:hypothetical protein M430DRAFT_20524 [Amorphotheca resinae ATCC 22711]PSS15220.1 hypothetical protein M430DRAFT_20524 [Amorphotheca resinae ATCC 22711]